MPLDDEKMNEVLDRLNGGYAALQQKLTEIDAAVKKFGAVDVVDRETVDRITAEMAEMKSQKDALERKFNASVRGGGEPGADPKALERKSEFLSAMRRKSAYEALEGKAVDADFSGNSTSGGVAVPEVIAAQILRRVKELSPMRQIVRVTQVSSPNYERLVDTLGAVSGWAAEATTRSETGTPTLQRVTFTHGELYAVPKASNWSLNDLMFDVESWLTESVAEEFAFQEGVAVASGNGTNKPTGFLNGSPSSAGDNDSPARAFGTLQYVPTGVSGGFGDLSVTSPVFHPSDALYSLVYALKARYRQNARFLMNKDTLRRVMTLRDADGRSLWHTAVAAGQPDTLMGYPVTEAEAMPAFGANAFPIAFGDFFAGYEMIDIVGMTMIRDDVTSKGHTLFYISRRLGGKVVQDEAIKLLKASTS